LFLGVDRQAELVAVEAKNVSIALLSRVDRDGASHRTRKTIATAMPPQKRSIVSIPRIAIPQL